MRHWSQTQSEVTLSSAEAELTGICRGTSLALGLVSIARDLGMELKLRVESGATSAMWIRMRCGLRRIRYLATADLWIQDMLRTGDVSLHQIAGADNTADILT